LLLAWLVAATSLQVARAELYTALVDMEELLETESVLIDTLHGYISAQEQRLATLRRYALDNLLSLLYMSGFYEQPTLPLGTACVTHLTTPSLFARRNAHIAATALMC
jgi:hypothetical protein